MLLCLFCFIRKYKNKPGKTGKNEGWGEWDTPFDSVVHLNSCFMKKLGICTIPSVGTCHNKGHFFFGVLQWRKWKSECHGLHVKQMLKCRFGLKCHITPKGSINPVFGDVYLCHCPSSCLSMSQGSECQCFHAEATTVQWWIMLLWTQNQESWCDMNVEVAIKMVLELSEINGCSQWTSPLS